MHDSQMSKYLVSDGSLGQVIFTDDVPELRAIQEELDSTYWRPDEIDYTHDVEQWRSTLSEADRRMVENIVLEFNVWDMVVGQVYTGGCDWQVGDTHCEVESFVSDIKCTQLTGLYAMVAAWETIHSRTYSDIGMTLLGRERMTELVAVKLPDYVKKKAKWYRENMASHYQGPLGTEEHVYDHARRVVVNCAVEGIFFSAKFAAIYALKRLGLLPGLAQANELISRDEGLHCRLAAVYYKLLKSPLPPEELVKIVRGACELECEGVMETHPEGIVGLDRESLCQYTRYNADFILTLLHGSRLTTYDVENPYKWMVSLAVGRQTSFFERRVTEYNSRGKATGKRLVTLPDGEW